MRIVNEKFCDTVNKHMLERDMRIVDFLRSLGLGKHCYQLYCDGQVPRRERAIRIANVLRCEAGDLWEVYK